MKIISDSSHLNRTEVSPLQIKVGLIQMSMLNDCTLNLQKAERLIDDAGEKGAQVVCLPELFNSRYFPQTQHSESLAETIPGETTNVLSSAARKNKVVLVGGSIYEKTRRKNYNTSVVFSDSGKIIGKYRKVHLPNDQGFYEQSYFSSGTEYQVLDTKYGKIGVLICFDQWYPEAARILKLMGANIIFYPTAIGRVKGIDQFEGNWQDAWEYVQRGHAIANSVVVVSVNRVGHEKDMTFWGGSFVYNQFGKMLIRADDSEGTYLTTIDLSLSKKIEAGWGFLRNRKTRTYSRLLK